MLIRSIRVPFLPVANGVYPKRELLELGGDAGSAYVFLRGGTSWSEEAKLTAEDGSAGDEFGTSVAASGDTVVVGAPSDDDHGRNSGSAYVFVIPREVPATVNIDPDTLYAESKGKWVTTYIELPNDYDAADIDPGTVTPVGTLAAETHPTRIGDSDGNGITDLMVKFDRQALIAHLAGATGEITLSVAGALDDGTLFMGTDTITVIRSGKEK